MIAFARSRFCAVCIGAIASLLPGCSASQPLVGVPAATTPAASGQPCIYLLNTNQVSNLSSTQIMAPSCYVYINDTANMSNSTITAAKILYSGPPPKEIGAKFPEATPAPGTPVSDPCPTIRGCSYLMNHPPSTSKCGPFGRYNNATVAPGCYKGLALSGTDTLDPGLYVVDGQFHLDNATVVGAGVTIYITANVSDMNFSNAHLTLSAPLTGNYGNVLFYRPPAQNAAVNFSDCTCDFTGILYFPTSPVDYVNTGGKYQLLIFGQVNLSSNEILRFGPP